MEKDIKRILFTEEQIQKKVKQIAQKISKDYKGKNPLLVGILRGSFIFLADLSRYLKTPAQFDFIATSSYGSGAVSSGVIRILKDLDTEIKDRHVILVDDILDTGLTINYLMRNLSHRLPASLEYCALFIKKNVQKEPIKIKYFGFYVTNEFVVGYGLDYAENYRHLPYLATLKEEVYRHG